LERCNILDNDRGQQQHKRHRKQYDDFADYALSHIQYFIDKVTRCGSPPASAELQMSF